MGNPFTQEIPDILKKLQTHLCMFFPMENINPLNRESEFP